jgi:hypothetical protein
MSSSVQCHERGLSCQPPPENSLRLLNISHQAFEAQAIKIECLEAQLRKHRTMVESMRQFLQDVVSLGELPANDCPFRSCIPVGDQHGEQCPTVLAQQYARWFGLTR